MRLSKLTLLIVSWTAPTSGRGETPRCRSVPESMQYRNRRLHRLHSDGMVVSYQELDSITRHVSYAHPRNRLYGFHEPNGLSLLSVCFSRVWETATLRRTSLAVYERLDTAMKAMHQIIPAPLKPSGASLVRSMASHALKVSDTREVISFVNHHT